MRIIVHDYAGHPFQVQLSRHLAARGHEVLHCYCGSTHTPRGELTRRNDDPPGFEVRSIELAETIRKGSFVRRFFLEAKYANRLIDECSKFCPEVVLSANTPSIPQARLAKLCRRDGVRLVSWVQDIYGLAAYRLLGKKLPLIGHAVGKYFITLDKISARASDAIVVITEDFRPLFEDWGVAPARIHVVHNWAPLDALPQRPRNNAWSQAQKLPDVIRFLYSGTLAMKHNPRLLLELARMLQENSLGELVVVSEGPGVEWLTEQASREGITSLRLLGFQPFEVLADVLGSADVLVGILEADAGVFSVPSKVLSYLCAGRPVLLAVPRENLAAKIVTDNRAGLVVEPNDVAGFCAAANELATSAAVREAAAKSARHYAETHFDIDRITDLFEAILADRDELDAVDQ